MYQRIVIKLGTSVLTGGTRFLDRPRLVELVRQCAQLHRDGRDVIVVTSGAIAVGRGAARFSRAARHRRQQAALCRRGPNASHAPVGALLRHLRHLCRPGAADAGGRAGPGALPQRTRVAGCAARSAHRARDQRNDAVATEEIKVGDNDNLSALVTTLTDADLLLLLTDQPGLFTADPRTRPDAELIPEVRRIDETLRATAGDSRTGLGTGGMITKLEAADKARRTGADVVMAAGAASNVILRAAAGEAVGTRFPALANRLESRKRWILAGQRPAGALAVDWGAARALTQHGRSLLPAGILSVEGIFARGDTVQIVSQGREIARGLSAYSSEQVAQLLGSQSDEIAGRLGFTYGPTVVHRNDMILLVE